MSYPLEINVAQLVSDFDDMKAAIEEREILVGNSPTYKYGNLIRSIPSGVNIKKGVVVHEADTSKQWVDITVYGDMPANFMKSKTKLQHLELVYTTNIRSSSYAGCTSLTGVNIPSSVSEVGTAAFGNCTSLTEVYWNPPAISDAGSSDSPAFAGCTKIAKVTFADDVTYIPNYLFKNATGAPMGNVVIPENVTGIGTSAFSNCGLTSIELPSGLETMGASAFYNCDSLVSIDIPDGVTIINTSTFYSCGALADVDLPANLTTISGSAFYDAGIQGELVIPATVTTVGGYAFRNCTGITKLTWLPPKVSSVQNNAQYAFTGCTGVQEVEFGEDIEYIPSHLCCGFTGLKGTLTIPATVTAVYANAFKGCTGIEKLVWLPLNVASVQNNASYAFGGCTGVKEVEFGEGIKTIPGHLCNGFTGLTGTLTIPETVTAVGAYAFRNCTGLTKLEWLPKAVSSVRNSASASFSGCTNIKEIAFGDGIEIIPSYLCAGFTGLTGTLTIPRTVTAIGGYAFRNCTGLTRLVWLPPAVESVQNNAQNSFNGCTGITTVEFPEDVSIIPNYLCNGHSSLTAFIVRNPSQVVELPSTRVLEGTPIASGTGYIYVPSSLVALYKLDLVWANYADQIRAIEDYPDICGTVIDNG